MTERLSDERLAELSDRIDYKLHAACDVSMEVALDMLRALVDEVRERRAADPAPRALGSLDPGDRFNCHGEYLVLDLDDGHGRIGVIRLQDSEGVVDYWVPEVEVWPA